MKKCKFYISCRGKSEPISTKILEGYYDTFTDKNGNQFTICFNSYEYARGKKAWQMTEKSTGSKIEAGFVSRVEAVEEFKNKYLNKMQETIVSEKFNEVKRVIAEAYATNPLTFKE